MSRFLTTLASTASVAAFAGLVYWGVTLSQLDPNDIPVIKKALGPARVAPSDPGGEQASFQGLSVNEVQAAGGASKPADQVYLAPRPRPFQAEDVAGLKPQQTAQVIAEPDQAPILKDAGLEPIPASAVVPKTIAPTSTDAVAKPALAPEVQALIDAATKPLIQDNLKPRPKRRPAKLALTTPKKAAPVAKATNKAIAKGTALVQLGAFDADAVATVQWNNLAKSHADLLGGKKPLIQKASRNGKTFYRLRVQGFGSSAEAKSFCSAIKARGQDCIPVTVR